MPRSRREHDPPRNDGVGQFLVAKVGQFLVAIDSTDRATGKSSCVGSFAAAGRWRSRVSLAASSPKAGRARVETHRVRRDERDRLRLDLLRCRFVPR
jgi:hypothetical protein